MKQEDKDPDKVKQGKKNRASGASFEVRVRKDLEEKGWIVDRWSNNVEFGHTDTFDGKFKSVLWKDLTLQNGKHYPGPVGRLIPSRAKWAGPGRPMMMSAGFPDYQSRRIIAQDMSKEDETVIFWEVIGVECKIGKYLDAEEKSKCRWLLHNNIFSKILIAYKTKEKNRIKINYLDFKDYERKNSKTA